MTVVGRVDRALRMTPVVVRVLIFLAAIIFYGAAAFLYFENQAGKVEIGWLDAIWWAIVTMTSVGYGDYFPSSNLSRYVAGIPPMLAGYAMLGFALSQGVSYIVRMQTFSRRGIAMHKLSGHTLVLNFPSSQRIQQVVAELQAQMEGATSGIVLVDDELDELPPELSQMGLGFTKGHPGRGPALRMAGAGRAERALILVSDPADAKSDALAVMIALALREENSQLHIVGECIDPANREALEKAGCDTVVCVGRFDVGIMAHELHDPGLVQVLSELTEWGAHRNNIAVVPVVVTGDKRVHDLRQWCGVNDSTLLGIRRQGEVQLNPSSDLSLSRGDEAVLLGEHRSSVRL